MSRTRSEGGATVVRVDAITDLPAFSAVQLSKERNIAVRPGLSVCLNEDSVNENPCLHPKTLWQKQLIVRTQPLLPLLASIRCTTTLQRHPAAKKIAPNASPASALFA